jgi:tetratricopeptide (TPR) repeat protein
VSDVSALIRKQGKVKTLASAGGGRFDSTDTEELDKAWSAMAKKDWSTAAKILTDLRRTQPDNPFVWYSLGVLHGRLGNHDIAIEHFEKAITFKPDYAGAYWCMGYSYERLKQYPEAIEACKKAIAIDPDCAIAYRIMGNAYFELKRYDEAIEANKKAIAIDPGNAFAYWSMGNAYCELKRYAEAIEAYEQFLRLEPTGSWPDDVRKKLPRLHRLAGQ